MFSLGGLITAGGIEISSATLNAELPFNSRVHCVEQFNAGVFDVLIVSDEDKYSSSATKTEEAQGKKRSKNGHIAMPQKETEFGLSRGIDFHEVATVLNFDTPQSSIAYTHRAGRTARAGRAGSVLSFVSGPKEKTTLENYTKELGIQLQKLTFQMEQVEAFRYRVEDCVRGITNAMVLDARLKDVKREMMASEKLKEYFDENPKDLEVRHHAMPIKRKVTIVCLRMSLTESWYLGSDNLSLHACRH